MDKSNNESSSNVSYAGYVSLVGRPNVGKSTWLNALVGERVSIISSKPQTTRHVVTGIYTKDNKQAVFIDTPGIHIDAKNALSRVMNRSAQQSLTSSDIVLFLVEAGRWTDEEDEVLKQLNKFDNQLLILVNKVDRIEDKDTLLPYLQSLQTKCPSAEIYPVSAKSSRDRDRMRAAILDRLPVGEHPYADDEITTASMRFLAAEQLREQLFRRLNQEVPYSMTVACEKFEQTATVIRIHLTVWVERDGQKPIVIGKNGRTLKAAATRAREHCEQIFDKKVYLDTWVRVRSGWADDEQALQAFGYGEDDH